MDELKLILGILSMASLVSWLLAIVVWAAAIQRYIEQNRERPSSYSPFVLAALVGSVQDYRQARRIASRRGCIPWFLRAFQALAWGGLAGFVIVLASFEWSKGWAGIVEFIRAMIDKLPAAFS